jgi:hypothetical protein
MMCCDCWPRAYRIPLSPLRLELSLKTVNNNTSSIFNKLNVGTRTEAAILARDRGLGSTSK